MAIKIEMLRCFVTVAKQGSLAQASVALGRTPSAVSMMLKQFEDHVGSPLFETARKSRLTSVGERIYEEARREVTHFDDSVAAIEGLARSQLGTVRLAVTHSIAVTMLPPVILKFMVDHPNVQIDMREMDSASITQEVLRERADIGIGTLPPTQGMQRTKLFSDAFGVVCQKHHPLVQNWDKGTWADVRGYVFIANGLCDQITDPDFAAILANARLMVRNTASLLALLREGEGVTVLPRLAVPVLESDIVFLPLRDAAARRTVHMMSRPTDLLMPAVREFTKLVSLMTHDSAPLTRS